MFGPLNPCLSREVGITGGFEFVFSTWHRVNFLNELLTHHTRLITTLILSDWSGCEIEGASLVPDGSEYGYENYRAYPILRTAPLPYRSVILQLGGGGSFSQRRSNPNATFA